MKKKGFEKKAKLLIKQSTLSKLLFVLVVLLLILTVIYVIVYTPNISKLTETGEGELGTLCIFCADNPIVLDVTQYTINNSNQSIDIYINWSSGNISASDFNGIFVVFEGILNCNYTISPNTQTFGLEWAYSLTPPAPGFACSESNFENVTSISAYAEVDIHLTQTTSIPDITFYRDDSRNNLLNLDNYFYALEEINYTIIASPTNGNISVEISNQTKNLSILTLDGSWFGSQGFNISASSDGDTIAPNSNTSFIITVLNEDRPIPNDDPIFDVDCEDFSWPMNTNKTIDFDDCWSDPDGDSLEYDYSNLNSYSNNISLVNLSGNRLKFAPDVDFNRSTYLYFYANDSRVRVSKRVDIVIYSNTTNVTTPTNTTPTNTGSNVPVDSSVLEITSSTPPITTVSYFPNENKRFSILAENYENVEWYVNGVLIKEGVLAYVLEETNVGTYIIEVKIINGTSIQSKSWDVTIEDNEYVEENSFGAGYGQIIFYLIVSVLVIVIFLIIWLLIIEHNKKKKRVDFGFGVSVVPNRRVSNSTSKQFNIPKE